MLDNQYSRVIRWVNRAQSMSAGGKYSDAILDVECARAELDDARQELLLCHKTGSERKKIPATVLAITTALCAVFFMASPLQVALLPTDVVLEQNYAVSPNSLMSLRERDPLSEIKAETATEEEKKVLLAGDLASNDLELDSGKQLSEDDVYRLIEVGRNALQKSEDALVLDFN